MSLLRAPERAVAARPAVAGLGDEGARLLAGPPAHTGAEPYASHTARLGDLDLDLAPTTLRREVATAGLLGRGGAGFPAGRKLDAAARAGGGGVVVINASEGEPASAKDRTLCAYRPHLVLDGALVAAKASGARAVICYVHPGAADAALRTALAERGEQGVSWRFVAPPPTYLAGETSAVIGVLEGRGALPRHSAVPAAVAGLHGRPTVVANAETLAHLALIARFGAGWFVEAGTASAPGSSLVTLAGAVRAPGTVLEVCSPVALGALLARGGGTFGGPTPVLLGGYAGAWIPGEVAWALPLDRAVLADARVSLGCGVIAPLHQDACGLAETARLLGWLARQSAGQCGPCRFGLPALAELATHLARGEASRGELNTLRQLAASVRGRGACGHPSGVLTLLESALDTFAEEVRWHLRGRNCAALGAACGLPLAPEPPA
ncbi:MAG: hypothetical protein M0004_03895 [Actinomycetota bacterium]|nr:hypothetical protein [Actinomycetota bacterium]